MPMTMYGSCLPTRNSMPAGRCDVEVDDRAQFLLADDADGHQDRRDQDQQDGRHAGYDRIDDSRTWGCRRSGSPPRTRPGPGSTLGLLRTCSRRKLSCTPTTYWRRLSARLVGAPSTQAVISPAIALAEVPAEVGLRPRGRPRSRAISSRSLHLLGGLARGMADEVSGALEGGEVGAALGRADRGRDRRSGCSRRRW